MKQTILEIKEIMKSLATINNGISEMNKHYIKDVNESLKELCEVINY